MATVEESRYKYYLPLWLWGAILLVSLGTFSLWFWHNRGLSLVLFLLSGITHGIYYGLNNHLIFHSQSEELGKEGKANDLWVHLVCSVAGAIALYFLFNRINLLNPHCFLKHLRSTDFVLFVIVLLGYTGLLPMTLWFFANSGKLLENLIKQK